MYIGNFSLQIVYIPFLAAPDTSCATIVTISLIRYGDFFSTYCLSIINK